MKLMGRIIASKLRPAFPSEISSPDYHLHFSLALNNIIQSPTSALPAAAAVLLLSIHPFLEIDGEDYRVIGVLAAQAGTRMGKMKFINWAAAAGIPANFFIISPKKTFRPTPSSEYTSA